MNRKGFTDSRGDEYLFIQYNTNEIRLIKTTRTSKVGRVVHQIGLSAEAVAVLEEFVIFKEAPD